MGCDWLSDWCCGVMSRTLQELLNPDKHRNGQLLPWSRNYDNPSGFAKYKKRVWTVIFRPHFLNTCIRFRALSHFIAEYPQWSGIWCYYNFTSLPVVSSHLNSISRFSSTIMFSWHIPHTFVLFCKNWLNQLIVSWMVFLWSVCTATFQTSKNIFQ